MGLGLRERQGVAGHFLAVRSLDLLEDGGRRGGCRHERAAIAGPGGRQQCPGHLSDSVKRDRAFVPITHAQRVVDDDHVADPARAPEPVLEPGWVEQGSGENQEKDHGKRDSQQQQEQLFELDPTSVALDRQLQVTHRRPFHPAEPSAVQQVNDERDRAEKRTPEQ